MSTSQAAVNRNTQRHQQTTQILISRHKHAVFRVHFSSHSHFTFTLPLPLKAQPSPLDAHARPHPGERKKGFLTCVCCYL